MAANLSGEGLGLGFGLDEVKEAVEGLDLRLTRHIDQVDSQHFLPVIAVDENRRRIRMAFSSSNGGQWPGLDLFLLIGLDPSLPMILFLPDFLKLSYIHPELCRIGCRLNNSASYYLINMSHSSVN